MFLFDLNKCSTDQPKARASVFKMLAWNLHGFDHTTAQSSGFSRSVEISLNPCWQIKVEKLSVPALAFMSLRASSVPDCSISSSCWIPVPCKLPDPNCLWQRSAGSSSLTSLKRACFRARVASSNLNRHLSLTLPIDATVETSNWRLQTPRPQGEESEAVTSVLQPLLILHLRRGRIEAIHVSSCLTLGHKRVGVFWNLWQKL